MTSITMEQSATGARRPGKGMSSWERWGLVLLVPYVLLFLVFVLYPVGYGLWLARQPSSYVKLFDDPIFFRSVINTLIFLGVGINLKMLLALFLSGFFVQNGRDFQICARIDNDSARVGSLSQLGPSAPLSL